MTTNRGGRLGWLAVGVVVGVTILGGCRGRLAPAARFEPVEPRVIAIVGERLVVPVTFTGAVDPDRPVRARLDDGREIPAGLFWVAVSPETGQHPSGGWLAPAGVWSATPVSASVRPSAVGVWAIVLDLPLDSVGQGVWLSGRRVSLSWIPNPALVSPPIPGEVWASPVLRGSVDPVNLAPVVDAARRSPPRRWRARLALGELGPRPPGVLDPRVLDDEVPVVDPTGAGGFGDPVLEALAVQQEARWRAVIERVWRVDAALAERLKWRIAPVAHFDAMAVPVWDIDEVELDRLQHALLAPSLDAEAIGAHVRLWLERQPHAIAWVIDDAGLIDGVTSRPVARVGVVSLFDRDTLAWVSAAGVDSAPDLIACPPGGVRELALVAPPRGEGPSAAVVHLGRWEIGTRVLATPIEATPPGLRLDPFFVDWDARSWARGDQPARAIPLGSAGATAALLQRSGAGEEWSIYLEFASPPAAGPPREEIVRLWAGPVTESAAAVRVTSGGVVTSERVGAPPEETEGVVVRRQNGGWACRVPVREGWIDSTGLLRLSIERIDAAGVRSAWPRPMLPWQTEPGRAAIDTRAWDPQR